MVVGAVVSMEAVAASMAAWVAVSMEAVAASMAAWVAVFMVAEAFIPLAVFTAVAFIPLAVSMVGAVVLVVDAFNPSVPCRAGSFRAAPLELAAPSSMPMR
jgi:hypothetical protein